MPVFLAFPILGALVILQSAIVSNIPLLHGTADLVLLALVAWSVQPRVTTAWHWTLIAGLLVSLVTSIPLAVVLLGYLLTVAVAFSLRQRILQLPLIAMLAATFFGTLITHALTIITLRIGGTPIPWLESVNLITLPSALLNLLLAIPVYAWLGDLANWLYPETIEI